MNEREFEDLVRQALIEEGKTVSIRGDGLERIRARTARAQPRWQWWPAALGVGAAAGVATLAFAVFGAAPNGPDVITGGPTPSASPSPSSEPSPTPVPGQRIALPVYFVQETSAGLRLNREFHLRSSADVSDVAVAALSEMLAGSADDPELTSMWNPDARVLSVQHRNSQIIVDLSQEAAVNQVGAEGAEIAVQQLVYTVTAALQANDPVRILVEGRSVDLWGHVSTAEAIRRANPLDVRVLVQLNDPAEGAVTGRDVQVTGEAAVFEANLPWQLLSGATVVDSGVTMTAEGQKFSPFSFTLTGLTPGTYTIKITEDDPSGGEGRAPMSDANTFTVR